MRSADISDDESASLAMYSITRQNTIRRYTFAIDDNSRFLLGLEIFGYLVAKSDVDPQTQRVFVKDDGHVPAIGGVSAAVGISQHCMTEEFFASMSVQIEHFVIA
jgi:hypothetical protein